MTSTSSSDVEPLDPHEHQWRVFSFEFPMTIGYRCTLCREERFEKPAAGISAESRRRR